MIETPHYEIDRDNNKVWLRLPLGGNGEVNHFLDAMLDKCQDLGNDQLILFCAELKSKERFYKNDLVSWFEIDQLGTFLELLSLFVNIQDPYADAIGQFNNEQLTRRRNARTVVDADIIDPQGSGNDANSATDDNK